MSVSPPNLTNCIFPNCRCRFRCKDLFGKNASIDLKSGHCFLCKANSTVYYSGDQYLCKSCIAKEKNLTGKTIVTVLLFLFILLSPRSAASQIILKFISGDQPDSVTNVIIVTVMNKKLTTGSTASVLLHDADFPVSVFRTGFEPQIIPLSYGSEKTVLIKPNNQYPVITVTGNIERDVTNFYQSIPAHKSDIDTLRKNGISTAKSFIASQSELQLRDFGGIGGLQTATSRGTASAQNLVTVNGIILNDLTTGTANLTRIPFGYFSSVELQNGGFSADLSNGAFGSIISFSTHLFTEPHFKIGITSASFETRKFSVLAANEKFRLYTEYAKSNNNFPFPFRTINGVSHVYRSNNSAETFTINSGSTFPISDYRVTTDFFFNKQMSGIPGPVYFDNVFSSNARLTQLDLRNITTFSGSQSESVIRHTLTTHHQSFSYSDPTYSSSFSLNDRYDENEIALRSDYLLDSEYKFAIGQYSRYAAFQSDQKYSKTNFADRFSFAVFAGIESEIPVTSLLTHKLSIRFETASSLPFVFSGSYSIFYSDKLHNSGISLTSSHRYPSLTELHYSDFGLSVLRPEHMLGLDLFYTYQTQENQFSIKLFSYKINNKIISYPKNPLQWVTINAEKVGGYGLEQSYNLTWLGFKSSQSLSINRVFYISPNLPQTDFKQIIYTPLVSANAYIQRDIFFSFTIFSRVRYNGIRYTSPENLTSDELPSFMILDSGISHHSRILSSDITIQFQIQNIADHYYEWVRSYPQPGRSFELTMEISL